MADNKKKKKNIKSRLNNYNLLIFPILCKCHFTVKSNLAQSFIIVS